ncbi:MAG: PaaI family thioesterase, partial [Desulfobacterales bacterium]
MQQPNDNYINKLIEMVNASPFPHHLRMQLVSISVDQAMVKLKTEQCHLQPFGIVHGGVLATLIDTATFWSVFLRLPEDVGLVNIDLKLNYLKSISTGLMTAEGRCIRAG